MPQTQVADVLLDATLADDRWTRGRKQLQAILGQDRQRLLRPEWRPATASLRPSWRT